MSKTAYITTAIPYVNSKPHIGFALEIIQADVMARYFRLQGFETFFLTGTDEMSLKNVRAAKDEGISTQELCDRNAKAFQALQPGLNIQVDGFIRTSSPIHLEGAQALWSAANPDDIYKKHYSGLYCVGCEDFYSEKDVDGGVCPEHKTPLEKIEEENYFFRLSNYQDRLLELVESDTLRIVPQSRRNETLAFIKGGLLDFSISRSRLRAGDWGIPVPGDPDQVMYVWFDALTNYITALGSKDRTENYLKFWENCDNKNHVIGKGINRFHTIYWPAMLMSAGLPVPDCVFVHGYLTINGEKISKSLGNVIDPIVQAEQHGVDPLRYYLLRAVSPFEDGDFSETRFRDVYNSDLANNLGNLARRVETIGEKAGHVVKEGPAPAPPPGFTEAMDGWRFNDALAALWSVATDMNQRIEEVKPWELQKAGEDRALETFLDEAANGLRNLGHWLTPFMPDTAEKLRNAFAPGNTVVRGEPYFPRLA